MFNSAGRYTLQRVGKLLVRVPDKPARSIFPSMAVIRSCRPEAVKYQIHEWQLSSTRCQGPKRRQQHKNGSYSHGRGLDYQRGDYAVSDAAPDDTAS